MKTFYDILPWLALWWLVSALFTLKDEMGKDMRDLRRQMRDKPEPTTPPKRYGPQLSWADWRARPSIFLVLPIFWLQGALILILAWPNMVIHWLLYSHIHKR